MIEIQWQWKAFNELSLNELYDIMKVRQAVFVLEQDCIYQDLDDLDQKSWHLMGWNKNPSAKSQLVAYLRVVFPNYKYQEPSIGRVLTIQGFRCHIPSLEAKEQEKSQSQSNIKSKLHSD